MLAPNARLFAKTREKFCLSARAFKLCARACTREMRADLSLQCTCFLHLKQTPKTTYMSFRSYPKDLNSQFSQKCTRCNETWVKKSARDCSERNLSSRARKCAARETALTGLRSMANGFKKLQGTLLPFLFTLLLTFTRICYNLALFPLRPNANDMKKGNLLLLFLV